MKRAISIFSVLCILITAFSVNAFAEDEVIVDENAITRGYTTTFNKQLYRGDLNDDGVVTTEDASEYLRVAAKLQEPKENVDYDITGDGKVTTADARKALRVAAGLELTATDEEIFDYFLDEVNSVKSVKPGFKRTATGTCKSAKVTITGAKLNSLNATNMEYVDYLKKNKTMFVLASSEEEYEKMLADAQSVYEPQVREKIVKTTSSQHYTYFPVSGLATSCRLKFEEIEDITLKIIDGYYIITLTLGDYTYSGDNPYPATAADYTARQNITYGKVFNLPEFNDTDKYTLDKVKLEDGKVTVKMDSTTGEIMNADYYFKYTAEMTVINTDEETKDMVTQMKNVVVLDEYFDMQAKELTETTEGAN